MLTQSRKQAVERNLVEYHDISGRHRMDNGMNTEFRVKLTPENNKAFNSQSLPMAILLNKDLIFELAPLHKKGIIIVLPFSNYGSPIFTQTKPNGELCLLVDRRNINTLIADDYTQNNNPVRTLSGAAQHLAGKSLQKSRLRSSLSLFADGGPTVSGSACIQFCKQNFRIQKVCARSYQICVCFLKLHA